MLDTFTTSGSESGTASTTEVDNQQHSNDILWTIIGAVIGSLVTFVGVVIAVAVVAVVQSRLRKRKREREDKKTHQSVPRNGGEVVTSTSDSVPRQLGLGETAINEYSIIPAVVDRVTDIGVNEATREGQNNRERQNITPFPPAIPAASESNIELKPNTAYGLISKYPGPLDLDDDPYSGYVVPDFMEVVTQGRQQTVGQFSSDSEGDDDYI